MPKLKLIRQTAFLCPTETLARQHYENFFKTIQNLDLDFRIDLFIGGMKTKEKSEVASRLKSGETKIVVGTHALLGEKIDFYNLAFVVVDEQHKFGVRQRDALLRHGKPHLLTMTATPIPRTLALIAYGDQDISVIKSKPTGRKEIITRIVTERKRREAYEWCRSEINKGQQIFVVCPLVNAKKEDEALQNDLFADFYDKNIERPAREDISSVHFEVDITQCRSEIKSVTDEAEKLKKIFPEFEIEILHGQMKSDEKRTRMQKFANGDAKILVASTIIEVGIDIPNATVMLIEGAERFGLAALHQLRGRVGRSNSQSYCLLFTSTNQPTMRLRALENYSSGFHLAEVDLKLRGAGEIFGTRQSGMNDIRFTEIVNNPATLQKIRNWAEESLEK